MGIAGGDFQGTGGNRLLVFHGSVFSTAHYMRSVADRHGAIQVLVDGHGLTSQRMSPFALVDLPPPVGNLHCVVLGYDSLGLNREYPLQILPPAGPEWPSLPPLRTIAAAAAAAVGADGCACPAACTAEEAQEVAVVELADSGDEERKNACSSGVFHLFASHHRCVRRDVNPNT